MPNAPLQPLDEELTKAIKASDADAFKVFYLRYYKDLFSFLWRRTREYELSKDLAQEVFVKIWSNRKELDSDRSIKSYLYRMANNLAIDHLRKKSIKTAYLTDFPSPETVTFQDEQFDLKEKILTTIEELPAPIRLVFTLNRLEGLKHREIAEALNISVRGVEDRMAKALKILREKLYPYLAAIIFLHSVL